MKRVFKCLIAIVALIAAGGRAGADTVLMKDSNTYDGKIISRNSDLIRMKSGDHDVVLPVADVESVEINDKRGEDVNYAEIERLAKERDKELVEKTGLQARERSAVDELLRLFFLSDEDSSRTARNRLLEMVKDHNPYRYLKMLLPEIYPAKLAPLLEVMSEMNPGDMRETLKETATSTSETARAACLRCLGKLKDKTSLELMKRGMVDEDPDVRIAATRSVEALGAREATPVLIKALTADDMRVQNASRDVLSTLWSEPGKPPLNFLQNAGWKEFWNTKAASVSGAWDPDTIEPLVPPGTVCRVD